MHHECHRRLAAVQQQLAPATASDAGGSYTPPELGHEVGGTCDPAFAAVEEAFRFNFRAGVELGSQLVIYYKGKLVVDLWGRATEKPYEKPKIVNQVKRELMETLSGYSASSLQQVCDCCLSVAALSCL